VSPSKLRLLKDGMSYTEVTRTLGKQGRIDFRSDFGAAPLELRRYTATGTEQTYCLFFEADRLTAIVLPKWDKASDLANTAKNSLPDMGGEAETISYIHKAATPLSKIDFDTVDQDLKNAPGDEAEDMGIALGFLNPLIWVITAVDVHERTATFDAEQDLLESLTIGKSRDQIDSQLGMPSAQTHGGPDVYYLWYSKHYFVLGFRGKVLKGVYPVFDAPQKTAGALP
jgi:hypothetical protein